MLSKSWFKSKTVWATVLAIVATIYTIVGDQTASAAELLTLAGSTAALLSRLVATTQLTFFNSTE